MSDVIVISGGIAGLSPPPPPATDRLEEI